jgi:hypothetical protein
VTEPVVGNKLVRSCLTEILGANALLANWISLSMVSDTYHRISALRIGEIILAILLGESFDVVSIQLDTSPKPNNPLVENGHQC